MCSNVYDNVTDFAAVDSPKPRKSKHRQKGTLLSLQIKNLFIIHLGL